MTSPILVLFLAVLCAFNIATIDGEPVSGGSENKRLEKLQLLKEQFELFRKELDQVLEDSSIPAEEIVEPVAEAEEGKRCECSGDDSPQKRCPNDCRKKSGTKTAEEHQPAASGPDAAQDSPIMKRFLKALPVEDQQLIQHSRAKKQFIERLIRKSHYGPNKDDVEADREAQEKRSAESLASSKRQVEDPAVAAFVQTLSETDKLLVKDHPSAMDSLKEAILEGTQPEEPAAKRELTPDQIQDVLSKLGNENDKDLAKAHLSRIENLAKAEAMPAGSPEEANEVVSKIINDIRLAKKGGINLGKLLEAMKKRANGSK